MGPRRSHKKSRNGCPQCKQRRLKCDERRPCTNCVKHGIPCSFAFHDSPQDASSSQEPRSLPPGTSTPATTATPDEQPTPVFYPPIVSPNDTDALNTPFFDILFSDPLHEHHDPIPPPLPDSNEPSWTRDLELMHHFCTITADTLATRPDMRYTWRVVVPSEGYAHGFVMHGILALSALHRAYLFPARRATYLQCADAHQARGLRVFRSLISAPLSADIWKAVLCFAMLVPIHVSSLLLRSEEAHLPDPISSLVQLFLVMRGIQPILMRFERPMLKSGLAPLASGVWIYEEGEMPSSTNQSLLPDDIFAQFSNLKDLVMSHHLIQEAEDDYLSALSSLELAARHIEASGLHPEVGTALMWPFKVERRVVTDIEARDALALVLAAHFCVLMHMFDHMWFVKGWSAQVLAAVERTVPVAMGKWLVWPRKQIYGVR